MCAPLVTRWWVRNFAFNSLLPRSHETCLRPWQLLRTCVYDLRRSASTISTPEYMFAPLPCLPPQRACFSAWPTGQNHRSPRNGRRTTNRSLASVSRPAANPAASSTSFAQSSDGTPNNARTRRRRTAPSAGTEMGGRRLRRQTCRRRYVIRRDCGKRGWPSKAAAVAAAQICLLRLR